MDNELQNPGAEQDNEIKEEELKKVTGGEGGGLVSGDLPSVYDPYETPYLKECPNCHSKAYVRWICTPWAEFVCNKCDLYFNGPRD